MTNVWQALRRGESARERRRQLEQAHEHFIAGSRLSEDPERRVHAAAQAALRPVVLDSWLRAQHGTIDPDRTPSQLALDEEELREILTGHPIGRVLPVVQRLLLEEASESGFIVAVGDAAGRLLWIDGDAQLRSRAADMGFLPGMDWSERAVGTSAPGSALALDHAIQVLGAEHYNRAVHAWSCTATPVHDPTTGAILGVIDVTGGDGAASPHVLPLVEATRAAVEAELKLDALRTLIERDRSQPRPRQRSRAASGDPRLLVLGHDPALLESGSSSLPLTGRHAEILLALSAEPQGLSARPLAEQVYGSAESEPTLRAEIVRLRKWLEPLHTGITLTSRPYKLSAPIRVDATEMLAALGRGAHRLALAAYAGPVLPSSSAPVAESLRAEVSATLREAMLQTAAADPLAEYAQTWATDDREVWETLLHVLPPLSPKRARVVAKLESLAL
ncbi:hypothetical protein [Leucobacter sp. W1478]|uniref:hypothetical protein n=1 Tax=Leucobacter sp. W1478 TaxID=3439065 RepID=UPI003F2BC278